MIATYDFVFSISLINYPCASSIRINCTFWIPIAICIR